MWHAGKRWGIGLITALAVVGVLTALGMPQVRAYRAWSHISRAFSLEPAVFTH